MKQNLVLTAVAVLVPALLLPVAGCVRYNVREGSRPATEVVTPGTQARLDNVAMLTEGLERRVAVQRSDARRTPTNTLEVWCTLRNRTNHPQKVELRTQFFSCERTPLEGPGAWTPIYLEPDAIETYRTFSTGVNADHYYIELMEAP
jgi:hypothetical protein